MLRENFHVPKFFSPNCRRLSLNLLTLINYEEISPYHVWYQLYLQ